MLSVIIPCCNEEGSVGRWDEELFPALDALGRGYEVVAVDDGSTDETRLVLEALANRRPISLQVHESNRGLGAALRTGFSAAQGEWIVVLDADLTFHPRHIAALFDKQAATGADLVAGSPYLEPSSLQAVPWSRRLPSLMMNAFYRGLFIHGFGSYTPMFRLYRASKLEEVTLKSDGFEISAEIAARVIQRGLKVAETSVPLTTRAAGASKLRRWRELTRHAALIWHLLTTK